MCLSFSCQPSTISIFICTHLTLSMDFPGGSVVKNLPANARDLGSIPGSRKIPGRGKCSPLQYSCLEIPMDRGAWYATVRGVKKIRTQLSD